MSMMVIITLVLMYYVVSAIILYTLTKGNIQDWIFKLIVVSFLPIIGWFLPSIRQSEDSRNKGNLLEKYLNSHTEDIRIDQHSSYMPIEKEQELASVSFEEVLLISDFTTRRRIMLYLLKQDAMKYLDILKMAVINEDTETSHYAVTAILDIKRELSLLLQKLSVEFSQNKQDIQISLAYLRVIKEYLKSGFLDLQSTKNYQWIYIQVLQTIIENNKANETHFTEKISTEITLGDLQNAEQTALLFKKRYPLSEEAYIQLLSIYWEMKSSTKFKKVLVELKNSPITLTNQALSIVRYWSIEENNKNEIFMG